MIALSSSMSTTLTTLTALSGGALGAVAAALGALAVLPVLGALAAAGMPALGALVAALSVPPFAAFGAKKLVSVLFPGAAGRFCPVKGADAARFLLEPQGLHAAICRARLAQWTQRYPRGMSDKLEVYQLPS